MAHILVVDDEGTIRENLNRILKEEHYQVSTASDGKSALSLIENSDIDVVLLDLNLPDINGIDVLKSVKSHDVDILVIIITGYASLESAVNAIKLGAYDYIKKPFKADAIKLILRLALETHTLKDQLGMLKKSLNLPGKTEVVARSDEMKAVMNQATEVSRHENATVLITGESGTGKDVVAKAIHYLSPRKEMPVIIVNCATLPDNLLESELFGYDKGAFTNATHKKRGLFELAKGGTIFLDEIGEMPVNLQAKLLGVLERKTFRRIGGSRDIATDVRIIAATNINPKQAIKEKQFREDLYYRLNVFPIHIPPLRERPKDIAIFSEMFLLEFSKQFHKNFSRISPGVIEKLEHYRWPGNVRELRNVIERICIMYNESTLKLSHLPPEIEEFKPSESSVKIPEGVYDIESVIGEVTLHLIKKAIEKTGGNTSRAAKLLGIPRGTLRYKMKKLKII